MRLSFGCPLAALICMLQTGWASDPLDAWTLQGPSLMTNALRGITYGNGLFVAVGGLDPFGALGGPATILTSPDGVTWTPRNSPTNYGLAAAAYGNGRFVAVGRDRFAKIVSSPDGINWADQDYVAGVDSWLTGVGYGNGQFVAVGGFVPGGAIVAFPAFIVTSPDGLSWTQRTNVVSGQLSGVAYGNGEYVAVGSWEGFAMASSSDGIAWVRRLGYGFKALTPVDNVAYGNGQFVVVGPLFEWGTIATSADAAVWTLRKTGATNSFTGIAYGNGVFVAVGPSPNGYWPSGPADIISSPDGAVWTPRNPGTTNGLTAVAYGNGHFVAVGANGTILRSGEIFSLGNVSSKGGVAQSSIIGAAGKNYDIDASTNLLSWNLLTNVTTDAGGVAFFSDPLITNSNRRFYRAVAP